MKKYILNILGLFLLTNTVLAQTLDRSIRPKPGPAPEVKLGDAESFVTSNGIKVFVVENHKLPRVSYSIDFNIKPALEGSMTGMSAMVGDLLQAGTTTRSKDDFNQELDMIGGTLAAGQDGIFIQSLKKHSDKMLTLASDMLLNPSFPESELELLKSKTKSGLKSNLDDPEAMSRNITAILNFGKDHPYGEIVTEQTVDNITLDACKKYFETYFRPNVAYMAVVGDITKAEAKAQIEKYFGAWKKQDVPVAEYKTPAKSKGAQVAIVNKTGAVQSVIDVTYPLDLKPGTEDDIAVKVANGILGGGSTGRLFQNLRETHGWTYGSYSSISTNDWDNSASFSATANSTADATDSSVRAILDEMTSMRTKKVGKEDLEGYKNYMAGTFALGLENPRTLARYAINIDKYNMPKDFYKNYLKNVDAVTAEDVLRVSKKYIDPSIAHITVAGDKASNLEKLKAFGPVTVYDIYGNVVKDEPAVAVPKGITPKQIIENYLAKTGGENSWKGIKDIKQELEVTMEGAPMTINFVSMKKAPNKFFMDVNANGMTFQKMIFNGTKGKTSGMGGEKELEGDEIDAVKKQAVICDELMYLTSAYTMDLKGTEKVNGEDCYAVSVKDAKGEAVTEYYGMTSGLKLKSVSTIDAQNGKITQTTNYSDYKTVDGMKFPFKMSQSGGQSMEMTVKSIDINKGIEDSVFEAK